MAKGVTKFVLALTLQAVLSGPALAQTSPITIESKSESLVNLLKLIEDQTPYLFSYDPEIFIQDEPRTASFSRTPLKAVLEQLLSNRYTFRVLGDYIIVLPIKLNTVEKSKNSRVNHHPIVDTLYIRKEVTVYDTIRVMRIEYDTIVTLKHQFIYDTVQINQTRKPQPVVSPYVAAVYWLSKYPSLERTMAYRGIGVGSSVDFKVHKLTASLGMDYRYLFSNTIYQHGKDSAQNDMDTVDIKPIKGDRMNRLGYISGRIGIGYMKDFKNISIGILFGAAINYTMLEDEKMATDLRDPNTSEPSDSRIFNTISLSLPTQFHLNAGVNLSVCYYFEYGLNQNSLSRDRTTKYVSGIRVGFRL